MEINFMGVSRGTWLEFWAVFAIFGFGLGLGARSVHADQMDEALADYSKNMNEYFKAIPPGSTELDRKVLREKFIEPSKKGIKTALDQQTMRTLAKQGITVVGSPEARKAQAKLDARGPLPIKKIQAMVAMAGPGEEGKRSAAPGGLEPQSPVLTPESEPVVVTGEQKIDQTVYPKSEPSVRAGKSEASAVKTQGESTRSSLTGKR